MSIPTRCAALMMVSPCSKGTSSPSNLNVGMTFNRLQGLAIDSTRLAVAFATDHVQRAKTRHDVGHHLTRDHALQTARDEETRRADAHAVRRPTAVAHEVEAEFSVAGFGVRVDFAGGDLQALHYDLEVLDGAFDRVVDLLLRGEDDARVVDVHRTRISEA